MVDPFEDREVIANLYREALMACLESAQFSEFSDSQLHRMAKALENALDDVETEFMRRDDPPEE